MIWGTPIFGNTHVFKGIDLGNFFHDVFPPVGHLKLPLDVRESQKESPKNSGLGIILLGQWLNFKLFGITYLVRKIKFKLFFAGSIG